MKSLVDLDWDIVVASDDFGSIDLDDPFVFDFLAFVIELQV